MYIIIVIAILCSPSGVFDAPSEGRRGPARSSRSYDIIYNMIYIII